MRNSSFQKLSITMNLRVLSRAELWKRIRWLVKDPISTCRKIDLQLQPHICVHVQNKVRQSLLSARVLVKVRKLEWCMDFIKWHQYSRHAWKKSRQYTYMSICFSEKCSVGFQYMYTLTYLCYLKVQEKGCPVSIPACLLVYRCLRSGVAEWWSGGIGFESRSRLCILETSFSLKMKILHTAV